MPGPTPAVAAPTPGMFGPVLAGSMGLSIIGSMLNNIGERQGMRALQREKQRQLRLWQVKRDEDLTRQEGEVARMGSELGGLRDVDVMGGQGANTIAADLGNILAAIQAAGGTLGTDQGTGILGMLLRANADQAMAGHAGREDLNAGPARLGQAQSDAGWRRTSSTFGAREGRAMRRGQGVRFLGSMLQMGGGIGSAIAPFLSGPSAGTPADTDADMANAYGEADYQTPFSTEGFVNSLPPLWSPGPRRPMGGYASGINYTPRPGGPALMSPGF